MSGTFDMNDACPGEMTIHRAGTDAKASPDGISTGPFWVEMLFSSKTEGENTAMRCVVGPDIRTNWHSHPRGQILFVLKGVGHAQRRGGPVEELRPGDCVWFAPDEPHWHGAAPDNTFSYISIQAVKNGTAVDWMEPVDEDGETR